MDEGMFSNVRCKILDNQCHCRIKGIIELYRILKLKCMLIAP